MAKVFLSYRRNDAADVAGRIHDRLAEHFGPDSVFTDFDSVPLGINFVDHITRAVAQCDVFLAVIGPNWLSIKDQNEHPRLWDVRDFVRIEIEAALQRDIPLVPILVGNATMPAEQDLPQSLGELALRNGTSVRADPDFHRDIDRLIDGLSRHINAPSEGARPSSVEQPSSVTVRSNSKKMLAVAIAALFMGSLATLWLTKRESNNLDTGPSGGPELSLPSDGSPNDATIGQPTEQAPSDHPESQKQTNGHGDLTSTDIDRPVWLKTNEIRGKGPGLDISYYYAFMAGPGEVKITADGHNRHCSLTQALVVELFDPDFKEILDIHMGNTTKPKRIVKRARLATRQQLVLRVLLEPCSEDYLVRLEGDIELKK